MSTMIEDSTKVRLRELLGRLGRGDGAALGEAYDLVGARLHAYARSLLRCDDDADEALQEVFLALARNRAKAGEIENPLGYLCTSVRNAALALRSRGRASSLEGAPEPFLVAADPSVQMSEAEEAEKLLADLPEEQREVLVLKVWGELTFKEIAEVLAISPNTAASRHRYALDRLRARRGGPA